MDTSSFSSQRSAKKTFLIGLAFSIFLNGNIAQVLAEPVFRVLPLADKIKIGIYPRIFSFKICRFIHRLIEQKNAISSEYELQGKTRRGI